MNSRFAQTAFLFRDDNGHPWLEFSINQGSWIVIHPDSLESISKEIDRFVQNKGQSVDVDPPSDFYAAAIRSSLRYDHSSGEVSFATFHKGRRGGRRSRFNAFDWPDLRSLFVEAVTYAIPKYIKDL